MSNNENENNEIVYEDLVGVIELESEEDLNKIKDVSIIMEDNFQ